MIGRTPRYFRYIIGSVEHLLEQARQPQKKRQCFHSKFQKGSFHLRLETRLIFTFSPKN